MEQLKVNRLFCIGNLKYIRNNAVGYNNGKFNAAQEATLVFKSQSIIGEITHACGSLIGFEIAFVSSCAIYALGKRSGPKTTISDNAQASYA